MVVVDGSWFRKVVRTRGGVDGAGGQLVKLDDGRHSVAGEKRWRLQF
jgi:hypothetical protein